MSARLTRRGLLQAGAAAGGAALIPNAVSAHAADVLAAPLAFDPAAFVADLKAAGYGVVAYYDVPRGGEPAGPSRYMIWPPEGRGFGAAYTAVMAKWWGAMDACPDHVEQVADHVLALSRRAA